MGEAAHGGGNYLTGLGSEERGSTQKESKQVGTQASQTITAFVEMFLVEWFSICFVSYMEFSRNFHFLLFCLELQLPGHGLGIQCSTSWKWDSGCSFKVVQKVKYPKPLCTEMHRADIMNESLQPAEPCYSKCASQS